MRHGNVEIKNRHKYLLQYHIIFVCKYRKKLLMSKQISDDIKQFSYEICQKHKVIIRYMETDKDHIHYMIETEPTMSISKYELTRQLEYKAKWNGRKYIKIDTFYASSQLCSVCGYQNPDTKDLSVRTWICLKCGAEHDRDINAAKNILTEGLRQIA